MQFIHTTGLHLSLNVTAIVQNVIFSSTQIKSPTHPLHYLIPPPKVQFSDDIKTYVPLSNPKVQEN